MNNKFFKTLVSSALIAGLGSTIYAQKALSNESNPKKITVTIEAPEVQTPQLENANEYFVVDFNHQNGTNPFNITNNNTSYSYSNYLEIKDADQWGGANSSKFITQQVLESIRNYKLNVSEDQKYFGFWWSAGDSYNQITFKNDGEEVASFKTSDLVNFINDSGTVNSEVYHGNPAYNGQDTGHLNEPFAFVNVFFGEDTAYDEIVFATLTEGGSAFESDNHTFSAIEQKIRGEIIPNNAPVANSDSVTTSILSSINIDVLANDTDADGDELTLIDVSAAFSGGQAVIEDNKIVYTAGSVPGGFSLTYTVQDGKSATSQGTVDITVIASPD
ncbi:cadherin-like domain-containing protein [Waterburya agarophytonicola K14]|uniref:Cadherin-like domain-containing protein n=1 Tax=Waterburya agarophytonicola KI4 TaxID=2874699 RepID=A0A964BN81_9CYAN|nr:Ig-like domain-containing protein [Waterburya agarophytonicola]MCC0176184.1 cadherin-like domain-containing protein [Waterburya agarophytonicola KI4]